MSSSPFLLSLAEDKSFLFSFLLLLCCCLSFSAFLCLVSSILLVSGFYFPFSFLLFFSSLFCDKLCQVSLMGDPSVNRVFAWTESSGSDVSADPFADDSDLDSQSSDELEAPFARHGPLLEADPESIHMQRLFWSQCTLGFVLDYRKFSIAYLQHLIRSAWHLRGAMTVMGRDSFYYVIHFESMEDLKYMCSEGPWSLDGVLLVLEKWRPNLVISKLHLNFVSIWVQLHGLPLEYQYPELAERMGHMIGSFEKIDWEDRLLRNIRFLRIKVRLNPWMPVVSGFMLRLDDATETWVQCRYERVHKLCTKCGLIGHTRSQCSESIDEVERMLICQRQRIQRLHQVPYAYDSLEPHFHNELRAYFNKRRC